MRQKSARLGQHFLTRAWAAHELVRATAIRESEIVLEIGPGTGMLTRELLAAGGKVIAIEKDPTLAEELKSTFYEEIKKKRLTILEADVRSIEPEKIGLKNLKYVIAANIPYYITGVIIRKFLSARTQPRKMALLLQEEVAQRIAGNTKAPIERRGPKESIISISVKAYGTPRIVAKVSRGNFSPPPSVDSAILLIDGISRDFFRDVSEQIFFHILRAGFSSKRKFILRNLERALGESTLTTEFATCGISEKIRAEDLALSQWKCLAQRIEKRF